MPPCYVDHARELFHVCPLHKLLQCRHTGAPASLFGCWPPLISRARAACSSLLSYVQAELSKRKRCPMQAQRLLPLCCSVYMATIIGVLLQVVATHKQDSLVLLLGEPAGSWGLHIRAHLHTPGPWLALVKGWKILAVVPAKSTVRRPGRASILQAARPPATRWRCCAASPSFWRMVQRRCWCSSGEPALAWLSVYVHVYRPAFSLQAGTLQSVLPTHTSRPSYLSFPPLLLLSTHPTPPPPLPSHPPPWAVPSPPLM